MMIFLFLCKGHKTWYKHWWKMFWKTKINIILQKIIIAEFWEKVEKCRFFVRARWTPSAQRIFLLRTRFLPLFFNLPSRCVFSLSRKERKEKKLRRIEEGLLACNFFLLLSRLRARRKNELYTYNLSLFSHSPAQASFLLDRRTSLRVVLPIFEILETK